MPAHVKFFERLGGSGAEGFELVPVSGLQNIRVKSLNSTWEFPKIRGTSKGGYREVIYGNIRLYGDT